jgi:TDG/mug DNA glycosylase family protein
MHPISSGDPLCPQTGLPPVHGASIEVLILGSFPGRQSLQKKEYYGNPRNQFWQIMDFLFQIDHRLPYNNRASLLAEHRIALWDVISTCCRQGSADKRIRGPVFNDIMDFLSSFPQPRLIALNGTSAGQYYRKLNIPMSVPYEVLPSTSPANTRYTLAEKVKRWEIILPVSYPVKKTAGNYRSMRNFRKIT